MRGWKNLIGMAFVLSFAVLMSANMAFAQETGCGKAACCGGCGDMCTQAGAAQADDQACSGNCGGKNAEAAAATCCGQCEGKGAQAGASNPWENCKICSHVFEDMELLMATDYNVTDFSDGLIFTFNLRKPALMDRFRALEKRDDKLSARYKNMNLEECSKELCPMCTGYLSFIKKGSTEEKISTPNGSITVLKTNDPVLVKELHTWADGVRAALASFDPSQLMPSPGSGFPEEMMKEMENCELCSMYCENPGMMTAAQCEVVFLNNGVAFTSTVNDPCQLKAYHDFEKRFHAKIDKMKAELTAEESDAKLCSFCREFSGLERDGAVTDWALTPSGTLTLFIGSHPELVKKIHRLGKKVQSFFKNDSIVKSEPR